jgi:hypothetical protein
MSVSMPPENEDLVDEGEPVLESFEATVVRYEDAPDECTIYPTDVSGHRRTTTWITAKEGSFCSLPSRS